MRKSLVGVLAAASLLPAAAPASAAPATDVPAAHATACIRAVIGGQRKCIQRGQFCARRYQRQYLRYGFSCSKRDLRGNWHLV
jgi:hypothetical protein